MHQLKEKRFGLLVSLVCESSTLEEKKKRKSKQVTFFFSLYKTKMKAVLKNRGFKPTTTHFSNKLRPFNAAPTFLTARRVPNPHRFNLKNTSLQMKSKPRNPTLQNSKSYSTGFRKPIAGSVKSITVIRSGLMVNSFSYQSLI